MQSAVNGKEGRGEKTRVFRRGEGRMEGKCEGSGLAVKPLGAEGN